MFSDESRFSLQSDSRRTFICRAPSTRYRQENITERHRYCGAGVLVWGEIILGSKTDLHVQIGTMTSQIYRDVILEQHVRLFRGAMGAQFVFMDDNARPHRANIEFDFYLVPQRGERNFMVSGVGCRLDTVREDKVIVNIDKILCNSCVVL
ncbi:hypothetical protein X975_13327, partial [Stegodyphus mimosarum]